ncbi:MAG TPA: GNAT family N-acetyltransferase [Candidatus Binataceae bacterium]|nr:GNAT family N-acetyltransferase [Candidatus Binataceae bacterium]
MGAVQPAKMKGGRALTRREDVAAKEAGNDAVYLFYCCDSAQRHSQVGPPDDAFSTELWKPSLLTPWPRNATRDKKLHFLFRTLLHISGVFPSPESGAMVLYDGPRLVHYSAFTPRYWRFPFLAGGDLQVGDTWTEPSYRGRGLAKFGLRALLVQTAKPGRRIWYVVQDINRASVKVAEDCGFQLAGTGGRIKRIKGFDSYDFRKK